MARPRCALVVLPAAGGDPERVRRSLEAALSFGSGDFSEVVTLASGGRDARDMLARAASEAPDLRFDWLFAVGAAETLSPDIFVKTAPPLRIHDALWGGAAVQSSENAAPSFVRETRLAAQDLPNFFHAALRWWIGPSHFVRPAAALAALQITGTAAWYADYMLQLWKTGRACKTAQALTVFREPPPPVSDAVRARLVEHLDREPAFMPVDWNGRTLYLPYTGLNPVIEREQMRGLFFEHDELRFLANRLPRGLRIVDAGANTGNHTLFFAVAMDASQVIPFEPVPRAAAAIRATADKNALTNVDLSRLGVAVGAKTGRLRAIPSQTAGLGAMHLVPDPAGEIPAAPLDDLVDGRIDLLKIDVEGMEMETLAGAAGLIARDRPAIYIEVLDTAIQAFMAWVDGNSYRVEKVFPDKTHCNYLLVNAEPKQKVMG